MACFNDAGGSDYITALCGKRRVRIFQHELREPTRVRAIDWLMVRLRAETNHDWRVQVVTVENRWWSRWYRGRTSLLGYRLYCFRGVDDVGDPYFHEFLFCDPELGYEYNIASQDVLINHLTGLLRGLNVAKSYLKSLSDFKNFDLEDHFFKICERVRVKELETSQSSVKGTQHA